MLKCSPPYSITFIKALDLYFLIKRAPTTPHSHNTQIVQQLWTWWKQWILGTVLSNVSERSVWNLTNLGCNTCGLKLPNHGIKFIVRYKRWNLKGFQENAPPKLQWTQVPPEGVKIIYRPAPWSRHRRHFLWRWGIEVQPTSCQESLGATHL